jgi:hypothetical protein
MSTQELTTNTNANANSSGSNDEGYSSSSPPATPITQPIYLQVDPTVLISITSHTYAPPLQPTPELKYDLRALPSPDNYMRSKYDGRSKRLREWLSRESVYAELLGQVEQDVMAKARELEAERAMEANVVESVKEKVNTTAETETPTEEAAATGKAPEAETKEEVAAEVKDEEEEKPADDATEEESKEAAAEESPAVPAVKPPKVLRIGVCCELGRHRSVAFVEELAKRQWPAEWAVEVVHRDVAKGWGQRKAKGNRRDKGGRRKSLKGGQIEVDDNNDGDGGDDQ